MATLRQVQANPVVVYSGDVDNALPVSAGNLLQVAQAQAPHLASCARPIRARSALPLARQRDCTAVPAHTHADWRRWLQQRLSRASALRQRDAGG